MGFDPFAAFTTDAADNAADIARKGYKRAFQDTRKFAGAGMRRVNTALGGAQRGSLREVGRGEAEGHGYLDPAGDRWDQITAAANTGASAYADAAGLGGQEGHDRAMENFRAGPDYQYNLQQQEEGLNRTANARGGLTGGANAIDIMRNASGMASGEYDKYVSRLLPYLNQQVAGAQGATGVAEDQAKLSMDSGLARGGMRKDFGVLRAGNIGKFYDTMVNAATSRATGTASAQANAAMAANTASGNLWDAAFGVGKFLATL